MPTRTASCSCGQLTVTVTEDPFESRCATVLLASAAPVARLVCRHGFARSPCRSMGSRRSTCASPTPAIRSRSTSVRPAAQSSTTRSKGAKNSSRCRWVLSQIRSFLRPRSRSTNNANIRGWRCPRTSSIRRNDGTRHDRARAHGRQHDTAAAARRPSRGRVRFQCGSAPARRTARRAVGHLSTRSFGN